MASCLRRSQQLACHLVRCTILNAKTARHSGCLSEIHKWELLQAASVLHQGSFSRNFSGSSSTFASAPAQAGFEGEGTPGLSEDDWPDPVTDRTGAATPSLDFSDEAAQGNDSDSHVLPVCLSL